LVNEFSTDKAVKTKAEMLFSKKPKEKKVVEKTEKKAVVSADELLDSHPQFKPVGKIDLDNIGKAKAAPKTEPEPVVAAEPQEEVKPEPEIVDRVPHSDLQVGEPEVEEPVQTQALEPEEEEVAVEEYDDEEEEEEVADETAAPTPVKTPGELKAAQNVPQLNVLGKIDLSTLNQSTRPKKKSK
jgi:translation initiation factor IF-2